MVERFLNWPLLTISTQPVINPGTSNEYRYNPSGTNLLDYNQALDMVRHMVADLPKEIQAHLQERYPG